MGTVMMGCGHFLNRGEVAYRVEGNWREVVRVVRDNRGRKREAIIRRFDFLICESCWQSLGGKSGRVGSTQALVTGLYGGNSPTDAMPCQGCGIQVVRGANSRTKMHTCSRKCTTAASKLGRAITVPTTVTRCLMCRCEVKGRAGATFCSSACRQRAYRIRTKYGLGTDEFAFMQEAGDYSTEQFETGLASARHPDELTADVSGQTLGGWV